MATNGRALRRVHRYRPAWQAPHADALGSRPRACHRRRAARAAGVTRISEAALRVGAGARSEDAAQASPVESRASSGSFSGQRCPAGTGRRGRAGAARAAPGPQADRGRPRRRPQVGRHPPSYRHTVVSVAESISVRPGTAGGSPSGPRTDQGGSATLVSHNRGCRTETPLPCAKRTRRPTSAISRPSGSGRPNHGRAAGSTGRPKREHPGPPNRHDLAAARDELAGVVSSAMMTELEKLMPQRRPPSPRADGARTPPVAKLRPAAISTRSSVLPRGSATFRSAPRTRGPSRRQRHRRPDPRLRETGDMNQAADRYQRRVGRVLPGDRPVPVRAAGRWLRSLWTVPPIRTARTLDLRRPGPSGSTVGGLGGWYDRSIM